MTPAFFVAALKEEIESAVKDYKMEAENQPEKPVSVYAQHIPDEAFENDTYYPFVLCTVQKIKDTANEDKAEWEASTVTAGLMVAVYGENREAWRDLLNLMEHIRQHLLTKRTVGERHRLILPISWEVPEVQPYPFWHGYGTLEYTIGQPQEGLPLNCQEIMEEE